MVAVMLRFVRIYNMKKSRQKDDFFISYSDIEKVIRCALKGYNYADTVKKTGIKPNIVRSIRQKWNIKDRKETA